MTCAICSTEPVAHALGVAEHEAAGAHLCVEHLLHLLRQRARWTCAQPDCGRKLYAGPDRSCAWCMLGRPVSVDVSTTVEPVKILRGAAYIAAREAAKAAVKDVEPDEPENMEADVEEVDE